MGKLQRLYRELGSVRQIAQDMLSIINPRLDSSAASIRPSTLHSFFTAREEFDQESGIYLDEEYSLDKTDILLRLPTELMFVVLSYLDIQDFLASFLVSRSWYLTFNSHPMWKIMFIKQFGEPKPHCPHSYAEFYRNRSLLDQNWLTQNCKTWALGGHQDSVYCAQLVGDLIYTGSRDNTIRVWDLHTTELIKTISTHSASVLCLATDGELLVSGSSDSSCVVYSLSECTELFKLQGHEAHILDTLLTPTHIFSCSKDRSVAAWDRKTGEMIWKVDNAHSSAVNAMEINGDTLFTAGGDGTIRQWNVYTGKQTGKLRGHTRGIACLAINKSANQILSGGNDRTIRVWDIDSGECLAQLKGHKNLVRSLHVAGNKIISASYDRTIRVWDTDGQCITQFQGLHGSWVFCVCGNSKYIVSTSVGKKPILLDFSTGLDHAVQQYIA